MNRLFALLFTLVVGAVPLTSAASSTLDSIKSSGSITIAYAKNALPISFDTDEGGPSGYSIDICKRIVASLQRQLEMPQIEVKWIRGNTPRRLAAVLNKEAQMECGTTSVTLDRQEQVDFSNIIFVEAGGILIRADSGAQALSDLAGKKIGVTPDTTTERRLRAVLEERLINAKLVPIKNAKDGMELLQARELDALAGDRLVLVGQATLTGDPEEFTMLNVQFSIDPYAFALPRGDSDFRLAVNRALAQLYRTGEIKKIFSRWFGTEAKPSIILESVYFIFGFSD